MLKIAIETENKMCKDTEQECEDDMSTHRLATALKRKMKVKTCTLLHLDTKTLKLETKFVFYVHQVKVESWHV